MTIIWDLNDDESINGQANITFSVYGNNKRNFVEE
jgi:hypothetical protein